VIFDLDNLDLFFGWNYLIWIPRICLSAKTIWFEFLNYSNLYIRTPRMYHFSFRIVITPKIKTISYVRFPISGFPRLESLSYIKVLIRCLVNQLFVLWIAIQIRVWHIKDFVWNLRLSCIKIHSNKRLCYLGFQSGSDTHFIWIFW